jgi:AhpD family alkylhydroperoxidase
MARIQLVDPANATGEVKEMLVGAQERLGMTPNIMKTMATSPRVLGGYLSFSNALAGARLSTKCRELIALAVAQANNCEYSLSLHTAIARRLGLSEAEVADSRRALSDD